jgi:hypothetical protein
LEENFIKHSGDKKFENTKKDFLETFTTKTILDSNDDLTSDEEDILSLLKLSQDKMAKK